MPPIESQIVLTRVNGIQDDLRELQELRGIPFTVFQSEKKFENANFHLHHALEGVFNISSHLISRFSGGAASAYKDIAVQMGKLGLVDDSFVSTLVKMAGFRNRIVHFYSEIGPQEYYDIIQNHLADFDTFLNAIKTILEHPDKYGISVA